MAGGPDQSGLAAALGERQERLRANRVKVLEAETLEVRVRIALWCQVHQVEQGLFGAGHKGVLCGCDVDLRIAINETAGDVSELKGTERIWSALAIRNGCGSTFRHGGAST